MNFASVAARAAQAVISGGDGVERRMRFLQADDRRAARESSRRRAVRRRGRRSPARPGQNWIERVDGSIEHFGATHSAQVDAGDVFVIQTPGGGGFG